MLESIAKELVGQGELLATERLGCGEGKIFLLLVLSSCQLSVEIGDCGEEVKVCVELLILFRVAELLKVEIFCFTQSLKICYQYWFQLRARLCF